LDPKALSSVDHRKPSIIFYSSAWYLSTVGVWYFVVLASARPVIPLMSCAIAGLPGSETGDGPM
jgi:hypothetical protein